MNGQRSLHELESTPVHRLYAEPRRMRKLDRLVYAAFRSSSSGLHSAVLQKLLFNVSVIHSSVILPTVRRSRA